MPTPTPGYYGALEGPVSSLNVDPQRVPATRSVKQEGIGTTLGSLGDFAGGALFAKGDKKKKPKTPLANQIYNKGIGTLRGYNALLGPTQALLKAAAEGDLAQFKALAPGYVDAISNADPMQAKLRADINRRSTDLTDAAAGDLALGSRLDPTELRRVQQYSRMNRTGAGFGQGSENDLFNEALDVNTRGRELYQQRFTNALGAQANELNVGRFNLAATGDPLLAVTGRPSGVRGLGDVPEDARNILLTEERERANKKAADAANRTALYAAGISAVGSIAGGATSAI